MRNTNEKPTIELLSEQLDQNRNLAFPYPLLITPIIPRITPYIPPVTRIIPPVQRQTMFVQQPTFMNHLFFEATSAEENFNTFVSLLKNTPVTSTGYVKDLLNALPQCKDNPQNMVAYMLSINTFIAGNFDKYSSALAPLINDKKAYFRVLMLLGANKSGLQRLVKGHLNPGKAYTYSLLPCVPGFKVFLTDNFKTIKNHISLSDRNHIETLLGMEKSDDPTPRAKRRIRKNKNLEVETVDTMESSTIPEAQSTVSPEIVQKTPKKRLYDNAFFAKPPVDRNPEMPCYKKPIIEKPVAQMEIVEPVLSKDAEFDLPLQYDDVSNISMDSMDRISSLTEGDRQVDCFQFRIFNTTTELATSELADEIEAMMESNTW